MEKLEIVHSVLLNKFILMIFIIMIMIALTSHAGIFEMSSPPPLPQ